MAAPSFLRRMFHAVAGGNIVVTSVLVILGIVMVIVGRFMDPTLNKTTNRIRGYSDRQVAVSPQTGAKRYVAVTLVVLGTILVLIGLLPYALLSIRYMYSQAAGGRK